MYFTEKMEKFQNSVPSKNCLLVIIENEFGAISNLRNELLSAGYDVLLVRSGLQTLKEIAEQPVDLILMNLALPDYSGLQLLKDIRSQIHNQIPIIVISAIDEEEQKVAALDQGANDYITIPFGTKELLARIRVALRYKLQPSPVETNLAASNIIGNEQLNINLTTHQVFRNGEEVKLTPKQYELLKYMVLNPDKLLTHRLLLQNIWGSEYIGQVQYVHVFIRQLRQKFEPAPTKPIFFITEPGLGYRFKPASSQKIPGSLRM